MPIRETREYELNEVSWWGKWVDETVWISKNSYAIFSDVFKDEQFFNRGGFIGVEKVPEDAVEAVEREFQKRRRRVPAMLVEEGRPWDRIRTGLTSRGYSVVDRMLVMESAGEAEGGSSPSDPAIQVDIVGSRAKGRISIEEWTRTYLEAFYRNQRLSEKVNAVMRRVLKDKKATVLLARIGQEPAGCAVMYRTSGGIAGAYCIGTAPAFRGKGIAAATIRLMRELAKDEKRRLILQTMASDAVDGLYVKQGFRLIYVKGLYERRRGPSAKVDLPSGEAFGVWINRDVEDGTTTKPFVEVFSGFEKVASVKLLFGPSTAEVISNLEVSLEVEVGYLRVDGETGNIIVNPEYLKAGDEKHLYLDVLHELTHVKQFREGKELYDRSYAYFERPTEIEAYQVAVEEARRIGMDEKEIAEYLRVEWVTEQEFMRFVSKMRAGET